MFEISRRADYAVRTMLALGELEEDQRMLAKDVARQMGVPQPFLHKIVADLVNANLVKTFSGPKGGLKIARDAQDINLLNILEAIEGPICINICLQRPKECLRDAICPAHGLWGRLQANIVQQLQQATLSSLVAEAIQLRIKPNRLTNDSQFFDEEEHGRIELQDVQPLSS
ncbi:MAG: Rrf2 family transcriptional regulator [Chloroflexi bacterium]|nr:MAG: Rrf2 family transcriptional regulator [Chloroflexota bacterium]MBL1196456.1 Rrf2 family transcriptional regulator [Chloroflexota bacterium]NOH13751.1 Rrf2 family transcriptional regulator [Chloroflexota bacterium]